MEDILMMKILKLNMTEEVYSPWQIAVQIKMDHNFLLLLLHVIGWMDNMLFLGQLLKEMIY